MFNPKSTSVSRLAIVVSLIALFAAPCLAQQNNSGLTDPALIAKARQAGQLYRQGHYAYAAQIYTTMIQKDPNCWYAYQYRSQCNARLGNRDQCYDDQKMAMQIRGATGGSAGIQLDGVLGPQTIDLLKRYSSTASGQEQLRQSIRNMQALTGKGNRSFLGLQTIQPQDMPQFRIGADLVNQVTLLKTTGKSAQAIPVATKLVSVLPNYSYPYQLLGCCYFDVGNFAKANEVLSQGCTLNPKDPYIFLCRAVSYSYSKEYAKSVADYSQALTLNNYRDPGHDEAMKMITGAFMVPGKAEIYMRKATMDNQLKKYDDVISDAGEAIKISDNYDAAYYARADAFIAQRKFEFALADYNALVKLNGKDENAYMQRANLLAKLNQADKAIEDYTKVISLDVKDAWRAYDGRAKLYDKQGKADLAAADRAMIVKLGFKPSAPDSVK